MKVVWRILWPSKIFYVSSWRLITHPLVSVFGRRLPLLNNIASERRISNWWDWTITWSPSSFTSWLLPIYIWFLRSCPNHMSLHSPLQVTVPPTMSPLTLTFASEWASMVSSITYILWLSHSMGVILRSTSWRWLWRY